MPIENLPDNIFKKLCYNHTIPFSIYIEGQLNITAVGHLPTFPLLKCGLFTDEASPLQDELGGCPLDAFNS